MHHGHIPKKIAKGLKVLRKRIDAAGIPSSKLDETLNVATWNIREFGKKPRKDASIHYIAEIIGQFDIVALVEVRDNLSDLARVLQILGPYWSAVFSDWNPDRAGNKERIAYVYDRRSAAFTGLAAEANPPRKKKRVQKKPARYEYVSELDWWRSPFIASFRAGNFDFILVTAHIRWGSSKKDRIRPLETLSKWINDRWSEDFVYDKDVIVMGDFNIPSKTDATYDAITKYGLQIPRGLMDEEFGSNLAKDKRYDQILHYPTYEELFTDHGGVLDFYMGNHKPLFPGDSMTKSQFTYQLSDHLPLWIQINTDNDELVLDQILES